MRAGPKGAVDMTPLDSSKLPAAGPKRVQALFKSFLLGGLSVSCTGTPCLTPGESVTTEASVSVPLPLVPAFLGDSVPLEIPVSAIQVAPVPTYEVR